MISIIIPIVRPEKAKRCIKAIKAYAGDVPYELITEVDKDQIGCPKMVRKLTEKTKYDWVMFLGDDTIPQEGFLDAAVAKISELPDSWGMVGLNDGHWHGDQLATHWLCHKKMLKLTDGDFFHTGYIHAECDRELIDIAAENDRYVWASDANIEHDNPQIKDPKKKDSYLQFVYSDKSWKHDQKLYLDRKEERIGFKLGVGIPLISDMVDTLFLYSVMLMDFPPYNLYYPKNRYHPGDIAMCRNDIARDSLKDGCTHLVFMDTDQVYHNPQTIRNMLDRKKDILGAKVHRRWPPFEPILQRDGEHVPDTEIAKGGLIPVDRTGQGCMMVRTKVYIDMEYPWYKTERDEYENVLLGEDMYFCTKAKEAGYEIFVDCDVDIGHLTQMEINGDFYRMVKEIAYYNTYVRGERNGTHG